MGERLPGPGGAPPVLWLGLIEGPSGYADEARGFLRALEAAGNAPAARHLFGPGAGDAHLDGRERALLRLQLGRSERGAEVAVHHYAPAWCRQPSVATGMPNVARTMFETDRVPDAWRSQLLLRDEVWVPCEHNRESFERGGIPSSRLRVIGGTLDFDRFTPGAAPLELDVPAGHLVYLSNFEFTERKAWRELLLAWARTFAPTDPVCLVLKTTGSDATLGPRVDAAVANAARDAGRAATAPVRLLARTLSPADLARLYAAADAYVLASRGEGWGRPYMEALAMGLPTIASNWSGNTEFMRTETSWLVDGRLVAIPEDHGVFADSVSGHQWFEPDPDALGAALAQIAADPQASRRRAAPARADLIERFGPDATARRLEQALTEVAGHERLRTTGARACSFRGPFGRHSSLAVVNDSLLEHLEARGRRVHARAPGSPIEIDARPTVSESWPPDFTPATDGPTVVVLHWEYGHPPAEWVVDVNQEVDRLIVPSEYVRQGYVEAGMAPGIIEVVPHGVDLETFTPEGPALDLGASAGCVFLFVGGTIWRKGIDRLMAAWALAFGPDDDVLLVVKDYGVASHYRGQTQGDALRALADHDDVAPVLYLHDEIPAGQLGALYRAADVLVAPYRGEGFGLPILEAMACGVPPVHTAIGPSAEFVPADGGWAVAAERVALPEGFSGPPLAGPGYVHEVEIEALAQVLRAAAADPDECRRRGAVARAAAQRCTWQRAAGRLDASLQTLAAEGLPLARHVDVAAVEGRARVVLYAPDWDDEAAWGTVLERWAATIDADADVTLVMPVRSDRAEAVMERILANLEQRGLDGAQMPDLALHQQPDDDVSGLVAAADAVLLDDGQGADPPPALWRRAQRIVAADPDALRAFAAALGTHDAGAPVGTRAA